MKIESIIDNTSINIIKTKRTLNLLSFLKLFLFVSFFYIVYLIINNYTILIFSLLVIILLTFFSMYILSSKKEDVLIFNENVLKICNEIITENSEKKTNAQSRFEKNHPFANDLDLFGENSLFEKINRTQTIFGKNRLTCYLLNHLINCDEILERQEAILELSKKIDWNVEFLAKAKSIDSFGFKDYNFSFKCNDFNKINTSFFKKSIFFIPLLNLSLFAFFFVSNFSLISSLGIIVPILLCFIMNKIYGNVSKNIYSQMSLNSDCLNKYSSLFYSIEQEKFTSTVNLSNQKTLFNKTRGASFFVKRLSYLVHQYENRMSPIIGDLLDILFLWNLQYAFRIGKIIVENENEISIWFETIGKFEALISFGLFSFKNKDFIYPTCCSKSDLMLKTENISHPLIKKEIRVGNTISSKTDNNVVIITGANMTGKSTFLRTIGVNLVLAMNGCPVCADVFIFNPMRLFTSMRTSDSLADGDSYFFSEIKRLKFLIDRLENSEPHFILLDEILKGTNSEDKLEGSKLFLEKIINMNTTFVCMIATHDIELTRIEEKYSKNVSNFCFELNQDHNQLIPDYKLKTGVTKTMNAIRLMKQYKIID